MNLMQDVRFAVRVLVKNRWFTLMAAVVLALGIGANNAVFTLVNAVLLRGLPFPKSEQIMMVMTRDSRGRDSGVSVLDFNDWQASARTFSQPLVRLQRLVQRRRRGPRGGELPRQLRLGELQPDARDLATARAGLHARGGPARRLIRWC